jgi:two-component system chemotaxis response regulator CheB
MGKDGAAGLLELKQKGSFTIAQNEETSVVFGMPQEAIKLGAAKLILGLPDIGPKILEIIP